MKKLVFGKGLNTREERDIKNYGKELNNMKKYLVKELGLSLTKAHKVIQTLNRNNKVIFNNGETSFFIKIKEVKEMKKLLNLCNKYGLKYKGRNSKGFYLVYNETNRHLIKGCTIESTISIINKYYKDV